VTDFVNALAGRALTGRSLRLGVLRLAGAY